MGHEYTLKFEDQDWYRSHRELIVDKIQQLPRFVQRVGESEFRLFDPVQENDFSPYDTQIFLREDQIFVSVMGHGGCWFEDVQGLVDWLRPQTVLEFWDMYDEKGDWFADSEE